jgi:hypothetical protein
MNQAEQGQMAAASDQAFARAIWLHAERENVEGAKDVRAMWKHSKGSDGYGKQFGPLTVHEINAFAKKAGGDVIGFARAIERAALIKAYTLLPELRQAEEAKHHRRFYRDGVNWGLVTYCGAIRALAMGQAQDAIEDEIPAKPVKPRRARELEKIEVEGDAEAKRPTFEAWAGRRQFDLRREDGAYTNLVTSYVWMGWLASAIERGSE